ncbi:MAG: prolipoprotein diacylglyceryl transferase [Ruminococcus sp.]|nr:prolipoprotein diacylglyceryl transferase [Ruminococcus sp.]
MNEVKAITNPFEIQFPRLGWTFRINPTAFTIFGIDIQWYGLIITFGLVLALIYVMPKMKRFGLDGERALDAIIGGVLGGIVGARTYYVILNWDDYKGDFRAIINTRNGGLAIYGGIIGAIAVGLLICKIRKIKFLPMLDITVLGFLIGQGIGRWGNFVNQEAFGTNTDNIFGMTGGTIQDTVFRNTTYADGSMLNLGIDYLKPVHPCFLYESVWCLLGFLIISTYSKRRKYDGQILLMYMTWYGAERFVVEGLRTDSLMAGNIRFSQMLSLVICITSVVIQVIMYFAVKRDNEKYVLYCNTEESRNMLEEARRLRYGDDNEDYDEIIDNNGDESISQENIQEENENGTDY